jgi:hypothetical protein
MGIYISKEHLAKMSTVPLFDCAAQLALPTLGDATPIGLFLFVLCHPRWPRQVGVVESRHGIADIFAFALAKVFGKNICNTMPQFYQPYLPWLSWVT